MGGPNWNGSLRDSEPAKFWPSSGAALAKLIVAVEPVDGHLSILADLDDVAVGVTHVAAPFPAVRIG